MIQQIQAYANAINLAMLGIARQNRTGEQLFLVGHRAQQVGYSWLIGHLAELPHHADYLMPFFVDDGLRKDLILVHRVTFHPLGVEQIAEIVGLAIPIGFNENT